MVALSTTRAGEPRDARGLAFGVLDRVESSGAYADLALHAALAQSALDARDRGFATELVYGTLRRRGRLDFLLAKALERPIDRIERRLRSVLRLGAYQLVFCDRVPDSAAVSESVRLAREVGLARATGLVNATLRRLAREQTAWVAPALDADPVGHLVHELSIPRWLAERWIESLGPAEAAALATASNASPPRTVRANRQRTSRDALLAALRPRFPDAMPCRLAPDAITLGGRGDAAMDPAFLDGRMTVQDEASQLVVELLDPRPGERILDACAAPGTKTTAIAERVGPDGRVVAIDRNARRLALVARDAERLGLENVETLAGDASQAAIEGLGEARFDRILVDAPCSGLGTLRRNPDARWRVRPDAIPALAALQRSIALALLPRLEPGGTLVYSTCTLTPEENDDVITWLLAHDPTLRRVPAEALPEAVRPLVDADGALRCWPHRHDTDGFFAARLERTP